MSVSALSHRLSLGSRLGHWPRATAAKTASTAPLISQLSWWISVHCGMVTSQETEALKIFLNWIQRNSISEDSNGDVSVKLVLECWFECFPIECHWRQRDSWPGGGIYVTVLKARGCWNTMCGSSFYRNLPEVPCHVMEFQSCAYKLAR